MLAIGWGANDGLEQDKARAGQFQILEVRGMRREAAHSTLGGRWLSWLEHLGSEAVADVAGRERADAPSSGEEGNGAGHVDR
jgi:hypothetical protein